MLFKNDIEPVELQLYTDSMRRKTFYHKTLRTGAVLVAFLLVFDSGVLISDTQSISHFSRQYIANVVGVAASVAPNEINTLSKELSDRGAELDRREREIDARARDTTGASQFSTYILSAILLLLLALILSNYVFDFLRERNRSRQMVNI